MASSRNGERERLILVKHREPFHVVTRDGAPVVERSVGGLVAALEPVMRDQELIGLLDARHFNTCQLRCDHSRVYTVRSDPIQLLKPSETGAIRREE